MDRRKYILALDQGTTSSRALVFDHDGSVKSTAQNMILTKFGHHRLPLLLKLYLPLILMVLTLLA